MRGVLVKVNRKKLRVLMAEKELKQEALAMIAGVSRKAIYNALYKEIRYDTARRIADALGITTRELLEKERI